MKSLILGLVVGIFCAKSFAVADVPANKCYWYSSPSPENSYKDIVSSSREWGTQNVSRTLAVGGIANSETQIVRPSPNYRGFYCGSSAQVTVKITSASSPVANITPPDYPTAAGKVFPTNIPGIGMIAKVKSMPVSETLFAPMTFKPRTQVYVQGIIVTAVILIKTGDIPPGVHTVTGSLSLSAGGDIFQTSSFAFTVAVDNCTIPNQGTTSRVLMDDISIIELTPGGPLRPFQIPLTDCATGSASKNIAKVLFNGTSGSTNQDASNGILGLDSSSKSTGIGIQILKQDGITPFPLGVATEAGKITRGELMLNFNARYIKTSNNPQPGSANAKANFTVSYN